MAVIPAAETEAGGFPGSLRPASLAKLVNSRSSEKPSLKNKQTNKHKRIWPLAPQLRVGLTGRNEKSNEEGEKDLRQAVQGV